MTVESNVLPMQDTIAQPTNVEADEIQVWPVYKQVGAQTDIPSDHFISRNGIEFAGTHIIIDLWGARRLDELALMEATMRKAIDVAGATLLHIHLHHFTPNGGISGVAVLAESHISVHTWPERNFAAFDVFMCGDAQPGKTIPVLQAAFGSECVNVTEHLRGTNVIKDATHSNEQSKANAHLMSEANDEVL